MSTASSISIIHKNGTVESQYCHHDGYISFVGKILYLHYQDVLKIKELISLGNMSSLGPNISPPSGVLHDYNNSVKDVCVFYGRDRQEDDNGPKKYTSFESFMKKSFSYEFNYIFHEKRNHWYLIEPHSKKLKKLSTLLLNDSNVSQDIKDTIKTKIQFEILNKKLKKNLSQKDLTSMKVKI